MAPALAAGGGALDAAISPTGYVCIDGDETSPSETPAF